jgi:DNA-binding beta-propeller fold protein YncE
LSTIPGISIRRWRRLLLLALVASPLLLGLPGCDDAPIVSGLPRHVPGPGGCLRDQLHEPATDQACPGAAVGLAGAQAVAVSPDGSSVYVAAADDVVALARNPVGGALQPALAQSALACIGGSSSGCAGEDVALSGADALTVSPDGRFVYVGSSNTATVSAFAREAHGVLAPLAPGRRGSYSGCVAGEPLDDIPRTRCGARIGALNGVAALTISPGGRNLYVVSYGLRPGTDSVVTLQRDPRSGGVRPLPGTRGCIQSLPGSGCRAVPGLEGAAAITVAPDGRFVYVASELSGAVTGFRRDPVTGGLTPLTHRGGCVSSGERAAGDVRCELEVRQLAGARSVVVSPDGRELYVAAFDPGAVVALRRNPISGLLAASSPSCLQAARGPRCPTALPFLHGAAALAMAPDGGAIWVISEGGNSLVQLLRNPADGALTLASASPTALSPLSGPVALAISPHGDSIYVASPFDDGVAALVG